MRLRWSWRFLVATAMVAATASVVSAMEPPTRTQVERYRQDGSLAMRAAAAREIGNHRMAPHLVARLGEHAKGAGVPTKGLPSSGTVRVFALLLSFADYPGFTQPSVVEDRLFGDGMPSAYPYESLSAYYRRSSYGLLEITGATLGWYRTTYPRSSVAETTEGREAVIREAIEHFDSEGMDFGPFDNDGDGEIDYFIVIWTGPHGEWAEFWWGYQTYYQDPSFVVDGVRLGAYSWQWENWNSPGVFSPNVVIHETGHALGLPDYYDYDDAVGPRGGVGGLDQMDGNIGDHNCFSKWVLGWLTPQVYNQGSQQVLVPPTDAGPEAVVVMHGDPMTDPFGEYFMVQHRRREGNDVDLPTDGLLIWHVDARTNPYGGYLNDNSYTDHKLLRLMEADGLEEIEQGLWADADDFYRPGGLFGAATTPSSHRYDGAPTNLEVSGISADQDEMVFSASLGSGCSVRLEPEVVRSSWSYLPVRFDVLPQLANCQGDAAVTWDLGDGSAFTEAEVTHVFSTPGTYSWTVQAELGDASCSRSGSVLVCDDDRCWQWRELEPLAAPLALGAVVALPDGRALVVGDSANAELFDPAKGGFQATVPSAGSHPLAQGVALDDGRVLVTGSSPGQTVNAELFDPSTDSWSPAVPMIWDRTYHSAVKLGDGRVLVAGGFFYGAQGENVPVMEVEVWDPAADSWEEAGSIGEPMYLPGLTLLSDGRVLLTGNSTALLFDPVTWAWSPAAALPYDRVYHVSVGLPDGRVLIAGGTSTPRVTIYDPDTGLMEDGGVLGGLRILPTATVLDSGRVLLCGGADRYVEGSSEVELFDPQTGGWEAGAPMAQRRFGHGAARLRDGSVLAAGGLTEPVGNGYLATAAAERLAPPVPAPRSAGGRLTP